MGLLGGGKRRWSAQSADTCIYANKTSSTHMIAAGIDVVHGHSSHHAKGFEVHRGRLIVYGAGDLISDYEGIRVRACTRLACVFLCLCVCVWFASGNHTRRHTILAAQSPAHDTTHQNQQVEFERCCCVPSRRAPRRRWGAVVCRRASGRWVPGGAHAHADAAEVCLCVCVYLCVCVCFSVCVSVCVGGCLGCGTRKNADTACSCLNSCTPLR